MSKQMNGPKLIKTQQKKSIAPKKKLVQKINVFSDKLKSFTKPFYLFAVAALIAVCATYSNHFHNDFHFDDSHTIYNNMYIRDVKNIPLFFKDATTTSSFPPNQAYRPGLTTLDAIDYWIDRQFTDDPLPHPGYFHASIFFSFVLMGILFFFFLLEIFDRTIKSEWNKYAALFATAWFWLHTANAETINYIIARSDSFSTFMLIAAFVTYIYKPNWRSKFIYVIPMVIGFLVKEPALLFIPLMFFYILFFERKESLADLTKVNNWKSIYGSTKFLWGAFIVGIILFFISRKLTPSTWSSGGDSKFLYLITQPFVILHYFKNFFFPNDLSVDTDWKQLTSIADYRFFIGMIFIIAMTIIAWRTSKNEKTRPISFGIIWFFFGLLPTSSVIPFSEVLNDHRTFLPYIGLFIAVSWAIYLFVLKQIESFETKSSSRVLLFSCVAILLGANAYGTYQRNIVWYSEKSLWKDASEKSPKNGRALMSYGLALMKEDQYSQAESLFAKGIDLMPGYSYLYTNMALAKVKLKDTAEATRYFKLSIEKGPNIPDMYYFYGQYLCQNNRFSEAIPLLQKALSQSPGHVYSRYMLMNVYANNYMWDDLDALVAESIKLFPTDPEVLKFQDIAKNRKSVSEQAEANVQNDKSPQGYVNLSLAYFNDKKYPECISACKEAIKLDPANADAYNNMSCAYNQMGEWDDALKNAELAVKFRPDFDIAKKNLESIKSRNESAYAQLARVKANPTAQGYYEMSGTFFGGLDYKDCIIYANLALQLNPNDVNCYNNLTAAYSRQFMWTESENANKQALKIDPTNKTALENQQYIQQHKGEKR